MWILVALLICGKRGRVLWCVGKGGGGGGMGDGRGGGVFPGVSSSDANEPGSGDVRRSRLRTSARLLPICWCDGLSPILGAGARFLPVSYRAELLGWGGHFRCGLMLGVNAGLRGGLGADVVGGCGGRRGGYLAVCGLWDCCDRFRWSGFSLDGVYGRIWVWLSLIGVGRPPIDGVGGRLPCRTRSWDSDLAGVWVRVWVGVWAGVWMVWRLIRLGCCARIVRASRRVGCAGAGFVC